MRGPYFVSLARKLGWYRCVVITFRDHAWSTNVRGNISAGVSEYSGKCVTDLPIHDNTACPNPVSALLLGESKQIGRNGMKLIDTAVQTEVLSHSNGHS